MVLIRKPPLSLGGGSSQNILLNFQITQFAIFENEEKIFGWFPEKANQLKKEENAKEVKVLTLNDFKIK